MRRTLPLVALSLFLAPSAIAAPIAGWDFEDSNLVVDTTSADNTANAITVTGTGPTWSTGNPGGTAASYSSMATQEVSSFQVPFNASGFSDVRLRFSLRPSNTASKWWRVEVSVGGGAATALSPLVELTGSAWTNHSYLIPAADGQADVVVRVVTTDSNGDGSGEFVQADGVGVPTAAGTLRIDDVIVDEDTGPVLPDAGPDPVDAGPLPPAPAITEVAWMGTEASANDEWIEIYNAGPDDIADLSAYVLVDGGGSTSLPAVPLAAGSVLVLEDSALTTSLASPEAEIMALGLTNSGEALRLCPLGSEAVLEECESANVAGAWPGGSNTTGSKRTMVRIDADLDGSQPSSWMTHSGPASTVTDANGTAILGTPGNYEPIEIEPLPDGGVIVTDGGVIVPPDAGPNAQPSLSFVQLSRDGAGDVAIHYTAADPDGDDTVSVALFYDNDDDGSDGVRIADGLPGGERDFSWKTTAVPPGTYHVFGVATDHRGAVSYAYAPGSVEVSDGQPGSEATLTLVDPDGVNDVVDGRVTVRWEVALPEGEDGTVSLYYDVDEDGQGGEPIIAGLPVYASEGEEGPRAYLWDPVDVPPGSYVIYAVLDWTGGSVSAYSQFVSVGGEGCACRSTGGSPGAAWAAIFSLVVLFAPRARRRRQNGPTC